MVLVVAAVVVVAAAAVGSGDGGPDSAAMTVAKDGHEGAVDNARQGHCGPAANGGVKPGQRQRFSTPTARQLALPRTHGTHAHAHTFRETGGQGGPRLVVVVVRRALTLIGEAPAWRQRWFWGWRSRQGYLGRCRRRMSRRWCPQTAGNPTDGGRQLLRPASADIAEDNSGHDDWDDDGQQGYSVSAAVGDGSSGTAGTAIVWGRGLPDVRGGLALPPKGEPSHYGLVSPSSINSSYGVSTA